MAVESPDYLIVGADSVIGAALMSHLQEAGVRVVGTSRRRQDPALLHCDLSEAKEWRSPWPVPVAIICAGVTRLEECEARPAACARVNVEGTLRIAKNLVQQGTFVIYLSSSRVFDGSRPRRQASDPVSPLTEYGRQKAEVERELGQLGEGAAAIVRLTKVFGPRPRLFSSWLSSLKAGEVIHPYENMNMAPVPLELAVQVLRSVADQRQGGLWQVSAEEDISYADAARIGAEMIGADPCLVSPVKASKFTSTYTSLDTTRLQEELGVRPPDARWTVRKVFTGCLSEAI